MAYSAVSFSFEEVLTSTKMTQVDDNIEAVRSDHKSSSAPSDLTAGTRWLDDAISPWTVKQYDGADWIDVYHLDPTNNVTGMISSLAVLSTPDAAADFIRIFDDSDGFDKKVTPGDIGGGFRDVQIFTSVGSNGWTKPSFLTRARVTVVGGGGQGGGAGGGAIKSLPGGGGGGWAIEWLEESELGATETATVGAGGSGAGNNAGNAGGTSSLGSLMTATGGGGGPSLFTSLPGPGGSGSGGDVNGDGQAGGLSDNTDDRSGHGGGSLFGGGPRGVDSDTTGNVGDGPGVGGSGGQTGVPSGSSGGAGADGIIIVEEYA